MRNFLRVIVGVKYSNPSVEVHCQENACLQGGSQYCPPGFVKY